MSPSRPHLLLITTDQQRFDTIHAAGNPVIFTPHLDWLCDSGIRYTRAYSDCPLCVPARVTMMTGLHAWRHGQLTNNAVQSPLADHATMPSALSAAGYQTRAIGKMHFSPERAHYGFEHMELLGDYYRDLRDRGLAAPMSHGVGQSEMEPVVTSGPREHTITAWSAARAVDFLETRDETRPFFLWLSFSKPHTPFDPHLDFWSIYEGARFPSPSLGDWSRRPESIPAGFIERTWRFNAADRFTEAQWQAIVRAYYACITEVDYALGRVFGRLRELNLLDQTTIAFTSDHGEMLGDHHLGGKSVHLEGSAHVPLLLRPAPTLNPPLAAHQRQDHRLACLADLLPTFLQQAGLASPPGVDGLNLLGKARRDHLVGACCALRAVIGPRYSYHHALNGNGDLLFDHVSDPNQLKNLADDSAHRQTAEDLRGLLWRTLAETPGIQPTPDEASSRSQAWRGFSTERSSYHDTLH